MDKKIKIFYYVNVLPSQGGQWYYAIDQLKFLKKNISHKFVLQVISANSKILQTLKSSNIKSQVVSLSFLDRLVLKLYKFFPFFQIHKIFKSNFESNLYEMGCSLLYVPSLFPISILIKKIPLIVTILDLCHLDYPNLKEFKDLNEVDSRNNFFKKEAKKIFCFIAESNDTKNKLSKYYKINPNKVIIKHFDISDNINCNNNYKFKRLIGKKFFFYPSNFLSHKNHELIINTQKKLDQDYLFVFCGNDRGHLNEIKKKIREKKLSSKFVIFKSLSSNKINFLYKKCYALIYPSFFGPANIPLFEAWYLNKPILYPKCFSSFSKNGAIHFNNKSTVSLRNAISKLDDKKYLTKVLRQGRKNYKYYRQLDSKFINEFNKKILSITN